MEKVERIFKANPSIKTYSRGYEVGSVFKTDDLGIFQLSKFNRTVVLSPKMIQQAEEGLISPIIVNENFVVIDGQHRLAAAKKAKKAIEYIVKPGLDEHDIVRMNTIQRKWSIKDYIEAFGNQGNKQYVELANLINKKYSDISSTVSIATGKLGVGKPNKEIKEGKFTFFNYEKTVEFLELYKTFRSKTRIPKKSHMAISLFKIFQHPKIDFDRLIAKTISTGLNEDLKVRTLNTTEYTKLLLDTYNDKLAVDGDKRIKYHIASSGTLIIDEDVAEWALNEATRS
ncbi:MAG: ParB/RepB/Spo0J family partition protein [Liquorilactobacillus ghanensis]|uniref:ParB N-terminal domain-containing protein n=1 Tax=Liquorilactobacillus ghanensis TaxID=399370 RepID=UPI0039ED2399